MPAYPKSKSSLIRSAAHTLLSAHVLHAPVWPNDSSPRGIRWEFQLYWMASSSLSSNTTFNMASTNHCTTFTIVLRLLVECQIQQTIAHSLCKNKIRLSYPHEFRSSTKTKQNKYAKTTHRAVVHFPFPRSQPKLGWVTHMSLGPFDNIDKPSHLRIFLCIYW